MENIKKLLQNVNDKISDGALENLDFNSQELTYIYNMGVKFSQIGDYKSAIKIFQLLLIFEPSNIEYIKSLAGSFHASDDYYSAYTMYLNAYNLDKSLQKDCLFYLGICAFNLNRLEIALTHLSEFLKYSQNKKFIARSKLIIKQIGVKLNEQQRDVSS